jgi:hypothetical protein
MQKHAVVITLVAIDALALLLLGFFGAVMRPDLAATYGLALGPLALASIPWATRIVLSAWWVPLTGGVGLVTLVSAWFVRGWNVRTRVIAAGLVWTVFALAVSIAAGYAPVFERLE